ncbi:hypothetical protein [Niveispirillum sp. BGYR6]|uniref:hypothetical protein n=1 Tax=Niveispirillum sp. BGYR6 TaxID=2971249 RepID=UPI0022B9AD32|nr:hypothetical protein [Niveispirillum sp. BGYR6]MDG5496975.1 hypothetical protein [Niveispirillum sp. BGYR6]
MSTSNAGQAFTQQFMDDTVAALKAIGQQLEKMGKQADGADDKVKGLAAAMKIAERGLQAFSSAVAKLDLRGMVKNVLDTSVAFERMQKSLRPVTTSAEQAREEFAYLKEFVAGTSFTMDDVTKSFIALKTNGLDASLGSLKNYGETAASMGTTLEKYVGAVTNAAKSNFDGLKDFGIKVTEQGGKVTLAYDGVTTTVSKNSDAVVKALQNIGKVHFAGGMDEQTESLGGALTRLGTNVSLFMEKIGEGGLAQAVSNLANWFADTAGGSDNLAESLSIMLTKVTELVQGGLQWMADNLPLVMGGLSALFGAQMLLGFGSLVSSIKAASGAMATFNAIASANPIGLVISALGLAAGAFISYRASVGTPDPNTPGAGAAGAAGADVPEEKIDPTVRQAMDLANKRHDPLNKTLRNTTQQEQAKALETLYAAVADQEKARAEKVQEALDADLRLAELARQGTKDWAQKFQSRFDQMYKDKPQTWDNLIPSQRPNAGPEELANVAFAKAFIENKRHPLNTQADDKALIDYKDAIRILEGAKPGIKPVENKPPKLPTPPNVAKQAEEDQALKNAQELLAKAQSDLDNLANAKKTEAEKASAPFLKTLADLRGSLKALPVGSADFEKNLTLQGQVAEAGRIAGLDAQTAVNKEGDTVLRQGSDLDEQTHAMKEGRKALEEYTKKKRQDAELDKFRLELQAAWDKGYRQEGKTLEDIIEDFKKKRQAFEETTAAYENSQKVLSTFEGIFQNGMNSVGDTLVNSLMKGENALQGLKNVALSVFDSIVKAAMQMAIINPLLNAMGLNGGTLLPTLFAANGAAFDGGTPVTAFASGGVVGGPTYFPMKGGVGLMGEAGPEAIMPLRRLANGRLGVETTRHGGAGGGGGMVVNMPITVQGSSGNRTDDEAYARMVGKSVRDAVDARFYDLVTKESRYGGTFNRAF